MCDFLWYLYQINYLVFFSKYDFKKPTKYVKITIRLLQLKILWNCLVELHGDLETVKLFFPNIYSMPNELKFSAYLYWFRK